MPIDRLGTSSSEMTKLASHTAPPADTGFESHMAKAAEEGARGRPALRIDIPDRSTSPGVSVFRVESDAGDHARIRPSESDPLRPEAMASRLSDGRSLGPLHFSAEDRNHAEYYLNSKAADTIKGTKDPLPNLRLHEFKLNSKYYHENIDGAAIPQHDSKTSSTGKVHVITKAGETGDQAALLGRRERDSIKRMGESNPNKLVQRVDEHKGGKNFAIPNDEIPRFNSNIKPDSWKTEFK